MRVWEYGSMRVVLGFKLWALALLDLILHPDIQNQYGGNTSGREITEFFGGNS